MLTLAAADILPLSMTDAALGVSLGLLTESFGREVWWGWQDGMRPGPDAPVWPMDAFRNRFLTAYGPQHPQH